MAKRDSSKRERLVEAAVKLAYQQGFVRTSLADIATESDVPLGNVYYYFKTKDDIGTAILAYRKQQFRQMQERLAALSSPRERLVAFIDSTVGNAANVARKGCPMGSLCAELLKVPGELADDSNTLLAVPMAWMAEQFSEMGHAEDAEALALQMQSALQGVSLMTQSFRDPDLLAREGARLKAWIETL